MKLSVNEDYSICLEEVFNGIELKAASGESIGICMRDDGFELRIGDNCVTWYSIRHGEINQMFAAGIDHARCVNNILKHFCPDISHTLIATSELNQLQEDSDKLKKLESAGVDNWEGYDEALTNGL